jgi:hypothetical protein
MKRWCAVSLVLIMIGPGPVWAGAQANTDSAAWSMHRVELDVHIDTSARALRGSGTIEVELGGRPSPTLVLELGATGRFVSAEAPSATSTLIDGGQRVRLTWESNLPTGIRIAVVVRFTHTERGNQLVVDPRGALASWVTGWYPSPQGRSAQVAGVVRYHLPPAWSVLSNGAPGATEGPVDDLVQAWVSTGPVDWSFAAARYDVDSVAVPGSGVARVYSLQESGRREVAREYVTRTGEVLAALLPTFGPYPFPGYGIAEVPDDLVTWGGSSEQGFFMAPGSGLGRRVNLPLLAHELSHGWWGNLVKPTGPATLMLTEALAQTGAALAIEAIEGRAGALDFIRFSREGYSSRQSARGYFTLRRLGYDKPLAELDGSGQDHNLSDAKGHWFYLMLRDRLGAERFATLMQRLLHDHRDTPLSLTELRQAVVAAADDPVRMTRFLADWLDRPGAPWLALSWVPSSDTTIALTLTQHGPVYDLDVPVWLEQPEGTRIVTLRSAAERTVLEVPVRRHPLGVHLDPDYRLLRWDPDYGPEPPP